MTSIQVSAYWTCAGLQCASLSQSSYVRASCSYAFPMLKQCKAWPRLVYSSAKYHRSPLCLLGDKGKSGDGKETSAWKALEQAMGGLRKEPSVADILRKQMKEEEFGGGGFGNPPGNGGDGSGGSEEESFASILDELLQVILATLGFIFVYLYMIRGEEMTRLAKDYIKYLFGVKASVRLKRAMYVWGRFWRRLTRKVVARREWLACAIVNTPTLWSRREQLIRLVGDDDDDDYYD